MNYFALSGGYTLSVLAIGQRAITNNQWDRLTNAFSPYTVWQTPGSLTKLIGEWVISISQQAWPTSQ